MSVSLAGPRTGPPTVRRAHPTRRQGAIVFAAYLGLSLVLFGLPVIGRLRTHVIAFDAGDSSFLMWMLAWWPHALLHGLNPFVTHAIFYPDGYNLAWSTAIPLPAMLLAPITLTAGPEVSWNVLQLLCPALGAFTAWRLCRWLVARRAAGRGRPAPQWPALVAGYVFGFSPYVLLNLQDSPNIGFVALVPVLVLLVLRHLHGELTHRRFAVWTAVTVTAQFLISTEVLATGTLFGAVALLSAFALLPDQRRALLRTMAGLAAGYAIAGILVSPYLYYFLTGTHYPPGVTFFPADVLAYILPGAGLLLSPSHQPGGASLEDYLGVPLLIAVALLLWRERGRRTSWVLLITLLVPTVLSLGGLGLHIGGRIHHIWLPWQLFVRTPLLRYAIPSRFSLFVLLPAVVALALWLAEERRRPMLSRGLAALVVASLLPAVGSHLWNTRLTKPAFFADGTYRRYLSGRDHVLTIPAWGPSQRWIADAGFPFALSTGSAGQALPPSFSRYPVWRTMMFFPYTLPPAPGRALRQFLSAKQVSAIVVDQSVPGPWLRLFGTLGIRAQSVRGVWIYRLRAP